MSHSAGTACRQRSRALAALGLLVAVWMNLALAPCAMALGLGDELRAGEPDCPHCPPAVMPEHHGMPGHDRHAGMADATPCAGADCMIVTDAGIDARCGQVKLKDIPDAGVGDSAGFPTPGVMPGPSISPPLCGVARPGAPPPLHKLYCVYLD